MKVSGSGSFTKKGLKIIEQCKLNEFALSFSDFYVTDKSVSFDGLFDSGTSDTYNKMPNDELEDSLASNIFYNDAITGVDENIIIDGGNYIQIPLLMKIISNNITEDIDFKTLFLTANDYNSLKLTVDDNTDFSVGESLFHVTGGQTAIVDYKESVSVGGSTIDYLYISNIKTADSDFIYYNGSSPDSSFSSGTIEDESGNTTNINGREINVDYVIYKGCFAYDERLTVSVADVSSLSHSSYIVSETGAIGEVVSSSGNILTIDRLNTEQFQSGDNIDGVASSTDSYSSAETQVVSVNTDTINSAVLSIPYISDGSNILLRVNIRYSSGFPTDLTFQNTSVTEIEEHNVPSSDSHSDIRLQMIINYSDLHRDIRDNRAYINAIVRQVNEILDDNGLTGTVEIEGI